MKSRNAHDLGVFGRDFTVGRCKAKDQGKLVLVLFRARDAGSRSEFDAHFIIVHVPLVDLTLIV